jgi:O-antigen ligase
MIYKKRLSFAKTGLFTPLFLFFCIVVFQLIPLPLSLIKIISYKTAYLYENLIVQEARPAFFTLSIYPNATIAELLKFISWGGIFFLVINKIKEKRQIDILVNLIIFFGLLLSLAGLAQRFLFPRSGHFGPFVNRNNFAGYINMVIPLALGYFLTDMPLSKRLVYIFSAGIMSLALFSSTVRAGILVCIIVLLFILFFSGFKDSLKSRMNTLAIWLFVTAVIFFFFLNGKVIWARLITLFDSKTYAILGHGYSWLDVLRIWKDYPLFGTGLGTFGSISSMYKTTSGEGLYLHAHNDPLQLLSEVGLFGFLFLALFLSLYLIGLIKIWFNRHDTYVTGLVLGGLGSILGVLVYSLLDFNLQIPANALLFFVILGLTYRISFLGSKHAISK